MRTITVSNCTNCGRGIPETAEIEDMWQTHCDSCNRRFEAAMRAEYPYGQCEQCGAGGFSWTCARGKLHTVTGFESGGHHAEGGCGLWRDSGYNPGVDCDVCYAAEYVPQPAPIATVTDWSDLPF